MTRGVRILKLSQGNQIFKAENKSNCLWFVCLVQETKELFLLTDMLGYTAALWYYTCNPMLGIITKNAGDIQQFG